MTIHCRTLFLTSSIFISLLIVSSLFAAFRARAPITSLPQLKVAQGEALNATEVKLKGAINGTYFGHPQIDTSPPLPTSTLSRTSKLSLSLQSHPHGYIGQSPTAKVTPTSKPTSPDEGYIGPKPTSQVPTLRPPTPAVAPALPILGLSYSGSGGPKHCRGELIHKFSLPPPGSNHKNGTCVSLPRQARCGVFFAGKNDNCEAQLFSEEGCLNTTRTFLNTVVFMPEERVVGALWKSYWVRCGVEAPDAQMLDPGILGAAVKPG